MVKALMYLPSRLCIIKPWPVCELGMGKLVFNAYNGEYFLSQVWMSGQNSGVELHKSKTERELEKSPTIRQTIALAATN